MQPNQHAQPRAHPQQSPRSRSASAPPAAGHDHARQQPAYPYPLTAQPLRQPAQAEPAAGQPYAAFHQPVRPRYHHRSLWDKIWKDKHGRVVIWQTPNPLLLGWVVLTTVSLFFTGRIADALSSLGSVSLIVWSLLEIFRGINYFRRALGLLVILFSIAALIKMV